ncbi:MAG: site-specific integrase [Mycobacterium sp.]
MTVVEITTATATVASGNSELVESTVAQSGWRSRYPVRAVGVDWPSTCGDGAQVNRVVAAATVELVAQRVEEVRRVGVPLLLDWLVEQPGDTWQQRWLASGADADGAKWTQHPGQWLDRQGRYSGNRLELMTRSLLVVVGADVLRPSLAWLLTGGKASRLIRSIVYGRDKAGFDQLRRLCERNPDITSNALEDIRFRCVRIAAAKGGTLADITAGDVLEILDAEQAVRSRAASGSATFRILREAGVLGADTPTLQQIRSVGQRSAAQLVDRYPITCRPVRDLLVAYLAERQPAVDYTTLVGLAYHLVRCFWFDLEQHHPGIDSLRLPREVAGAWKRRLRTKTTIIVRDGQRVEIESERLNYLDALAAVRAFYLDVAGWGLDDPIRWGLWVAPCPISQADLMRRKSIRRRKARMDGRTRERLPVLPVLVESVDRWRRESAQLLQAGQQTQPGEQFSAAGKTLTRIDRPHATADNVWVRDPETGKPRLFNSEEEHAFWAWAIIEVLRHTGIRVEELFELSHHSLIQYRLPTTGELVPLLQIAPSKTDAERLLVVSPELADVLSAIICRVRSPDGTIPPVCARDRHELVWLPPSPLLFQRRIRTENHSLSAALVGRLLDKALARTGLTDPDGTPLHFTPHDFRRMFITEIIGNGLPPHIAQVIAGHRDIGVTMGYKAVYPDEAITAHLAFIARRRTLRPTEEYRQPTDEEWQQFLGHFERRKVSIGACGRAFGTPCIHEHACLRCALLWPDPAQRTRLVEIRDNLKARIAEAQREGWLGEVEGLQVSLAGAEDKLTQIEKRYLPTETATNLGIPAIPTKSSD